MVYIEGKSVIYVGKCETLFRLDQILGLQIQLSTGLSLRRVYQWYMELS